MLTQLDLSKEKKTAEVRFAETSAVYVYVFPASVIYSIKQVIIACRAPFVGYKINPAAT